VFVATRPAWMRPQYVITYGAVLGLLVGLAVPG
jgi:hypothetical protein